MTKGDRIARLGRVPDLEWRVRAVVNTDLKELASELEKELNAAIAEKYHLSMMMERQEKDGIVLVFHRQPHLVEEPGQPPDAVNPDSN